MKKWILIVCIALVGLAFSGSFKKAFTEDDLVYIPATRQRAGDSKAGYKYLITGDYLKSGIPLSYFRLGFGKAGKMYLERDGMNREISYEYTAVKAPNGEIVVAPNCLQCHAQVFDGKLYIGLGNTSIDFSTNQRLDPKTAASAERILKNVDPAKYEAAEPFLKVVKTIGGQLYTQVRGVNAADRLAALLVAHRDPNTLRWSEKAIMDIPDVIVPTDVPAWWLLKKKHAMFYNGFGRGDFGRFLMASNLLTVNDTAESREVDSHFNDVLSYLLTIEPPVYPLPINKFLAHEGEVIFVKNCAKCHGHYGSGGEYPNLLIPESVVQTDSLLYKSNYQAPQFVDWFNNSWFSKGDHPARLEPFNGYIAPPLDGIWITAPYLHNGSVPTLEALLDSRKRPAFWSRDFNDPQYDYVQVGWKFSKKDSAAGTTEYNTQLPGYGNYGHRFGDKLSDKERKSLIEYLKTL